MFSGDILLHSVLGCFDQICTAHTHQLLLRSFRSQFWYRH